MNIYTPLPIFIIPLLSDVSPHGFTMWGDVSDLNTGFSHQVKDYFSSIPASLAASAMWSTKTWAKVSLEPIPERTGFTS